MGTEARARLGLAALLAVTLLGFSRVFAEGDYPGPVMLGILISGAIAMVTRRLGFAVWATFAASLAGLAWYLMLVFASDQTFYGVPTLGAASQVLDEAVGAYELSNIDYAPVPLRPGYLILTITSMWLLTTLAEIATFRWRRPLVVAILASFLMSFLLIAGVPQGGSFFAILFLLGLLVYLGLESAHRLRSWGRWVSAWAAKRWDTEVTTAPLARGMGASALAAALIAPLFLPSIGQGFLDWRNPTGGGLGGGQVDTLVSLAPRLINQSKTRLFRVRASEPAYWRLTTLTYFDGNTWHPESQRTRLSNNRVATDVPPPQPGRVVTQRYQIDALEGDLLPAASLPETIGFEGSNASEQDSALEFNPLTGDVETANPLRDGMVYNVNSIVPDVSFEDMKKGRVASLDSFEFTHPNYIPQNTYRVPEAFCPADAREDCSPEDLRRSKIFKIAHRWTDDAESSFEKLLALQNRFRGQFDHQLPGRTDFVGDVEVKPSSSAKYLLRFLTTNRVGYCQQFATAFAVLARMLGYPTRVAVGFLPGETKVEDPDYFTVRGNDAHAWPEVYFVDIGWVQFEPTPRTDSPPPVYTQARLPGAGVNPPEVAGNGGRARQGQQNARGAGRGREIREPGRAGRGRDRGIEWRPAFVRLVSIFGGMGLLFLLVIPLLKFALTRRRYLGAHDSTGVAQAAFAEFEQEAADLAGVRSPAESPNAYVRRLIAGRKVPSSAALRLAGLFEAAAYAPVAVSTSQASEARRLVRKLRRDLWSQAGWWDRVERLFSPAVVLAEIAPANGPSAGAGPPPRGGLARSRSRRASGP